MIYHLIINYLPHQILIFHLHQILQILLILHHPIIIIIHIIKQNVMVKVVIPVENAKFVYKKIGKIFFWFFFIYFFLIFSDAARECRRKKKEYIKCLEERVTGLEKQNKALIEELRQLKELYCQRDDTNTKTTTATR